METMNDAERAGFEDVYPAAEILVFEDGKYAKRHESRWQSDAVEAINRMWQAFQAGAAWQRAQGAVPEGWKLVPIEPTEEMRTAFNRVDAAVYRQPNRQLFKAKHAYAAMLAAAPTQPVVQAAVGVPKGWVIAPQEIHLSASDIELINGMCGDGNEESGYGPYQDGTLYIGYALQDDGSKVYGLHISCDECPEEGVTTLAEFSAAPAHPAERQDQVEVQRLREALEEIRHANMNGPVSESNAGCIKRIEQIAERALAASTGQEVES